MSREMPLSIDFSPILNAEICFSYGREIEMPNDSAPQEIYRESDYLALQMNHWQMDHGPTALFQKHFKEITQDRKIMAIVSPKRQPSNEEEKSKIGEFCIYNTTDLHAVDIYVDLEWFSFYQLESNITHGGPELLRQSHLKITLSCTETEFCADADDPDKKEYPTYPITDLTVILKIGNNSIASNE